MDKDKLCRLVFTVALMLLIFCIIGFFIVEKGSSEYVVLVLSAIINAGITFMVILLLCVKKKK